MAGAIAGAGACSGSASETGDDTSGSTSSASIGIGDINVNITDGIVTEDGNGDGQIKFPMCHNGQTIEVALAAVPAHLAHGDTMGPCKYVDIIEPEPESEPNPVIEPEPTPEPEPIVEPEPEPTPEPEPVVEPEV